MRPHLQPHFDQLSAAAWNEIIPGDKTVATPYDAEALSAHFGRKNKKRTEQIEGILETLKGVGRL